MRDIIDSYLWCDSFMYETWFIDVCDMLRHGEGSPSCSHTYDITHFCVTWLIHMCDMSQLYICHNSCICVTCCGMGSNPPILWYVWHNSIPCHSPICHMTDSYVGHDSFLCDMTHSYVWHDSFICTWHDSFTRVKWLIHKRGMTRLHLWHDSFVCVAWLIHVCDMFHLDMLW